MPKAAIATGCVDHVVPLPKIPQAVAQLISQGVRAEARV
jgi:chemotaxis response regulator CheB